MSKEEDQRHYQRDDNHEKAKKLLERQSQLVKAYNAKRLGFWKGKRKAA